MRITVWYERRVHKELLKCGRCSSLIVRADRPIYKILIHTTGNSFDVLLRCKALLVRIVSFDSDSRGW
jgi:hypothetical protein